jgi:DNA-binding XRE family transcriptional regulator
VDIACWPKSLVPEGRTVRVAAGRRYPVLQLSVAKIFSEFFGLGGTVRKDIKTEFVPAKPHSKITSGEVIRMLRELKGWTQAELARRSRISMTNISLLENEKIEIGKKRAQQLAGAFEVHPAIIMFPEYEATEIQKAA